ncbi:MAG: universal stress protein [Proteobacteria bacterium]|nr:universal stress protein [Pseudomonadota bacterium]
MFLLYVDEKPGSGIWRDDSRTQQQLETLEKDEAYLRALADRVGGEVAESVGLPAVSDERMRVRIGTGDPSAQILGAAADSEADLIVMGTHGRTSLRDLFVGSTAEQVTRKASGAVLASSPRGIRSCVTELCGPTPLCVSIPTVACR